MNSSVGKSVWSSIFFSVSLNSLSKFDPFLLPSQCLVPMWPCGAGAALPLHLAAHLRARVTWQHAGHQLLPDALPDRRAVAVPAAAAGAAHRGGGAALLLKRRCYVTACNRNSFHPARCSSWTCAPTSSSFRCGNLTEWRSGCSSCFVCTCLCCGGRAESAGVTKTDLCHTHGCRYASESWRNPDRNKERLLSLW